MTIVAFPGTSISVEKTTLSGEDLLKGIIEDLEKKSIGDKMLVIASCPPDGYRIFLNENDPTTVLQWIYYARYVLNEFEAGYIATLP